MSNHLDHLVIATHNAGKAKEISALLGPYVSSFETAGDLNLPEPEETGLTFAENAILKASLAAKASGKPALADDSGLSVNALDGAPGIYSARWAGETKNFEIAMARIHQTMSEAKSEDNGAKFVCALALAFPDGTHHVFEGEIEGTIVAPARGTYGFGYDPIFQPRGYPVTFGEMIPSEKESMSHRARAFTLLVKEFFNPA